MRGKKVAIGGPPGPNRSRDIDIFPKTDQNHLFFPKFLKFEFWDFKFFSMAPKGSNSPFITYN